MAKNRQRRDARRRTTAGGRSTALTRDDIMVLIQAATRYAGVSARVAAPRVADLNRIGAAAPSPPLDPAVLLVEEILARLRLAWENGWQPLELVHTARRRTSAATSQWLARAILVEAQRTDAVDRAPREWAEQLAQLSSRQQSAIDTTILPVAGTAEVEQWVVALVALDLLQHLPGSQPLLPPPSRWGERRRSAAVAKSADHRQAKALTKIRALLAKAESTGFAAEAEALTAKAQELMTRHAIDEALLGDGSGVGIEVDGIRVLIHHPYAVEKVGLLDVIARANRTRAVWHDYSSCATLVGVPTDLMQVEMLFTSTLVQATTAMTQAGRQSGERDRTSSFRKAFLMAYAIRIGERLAETTEHVAATYSTDLVPVMQRQADAVEAEFERLFPHVTSGPRRRQVDARGWNAGRRAADAAVLPAGEVGPTAG